MAEVVGEGGIDAVPRELFQFAWYQTMQWSDGKIRILEPGVDYPSWMTIEDLTKRLKRNAGRQGGRARVWLDDQGRVNLFMTRDQRRI